MNEGVKIFVNICAEVISPAGPVYEFGSLQVPGQEGFSDLRSLFPGVKYIGCDMRAGVGVDRIADLEKGLPLADRSVPFVLCMETLEHVFDVFKALSEMKRILIDEDGVLIISSLLNCAIHSYPFDYWRFTPECFSRLLSDFDISLVGARGAPDFPVSIFGVGIKTKDINKWEPILCSIATKYDRELKKYLRYDTSLWRSTKLAAFKIANRKKYLAKTQIVYTSWSINKADGKINFT